MSVLSRNTFSALTVYVASTRAEVCIFPAPVTSYVAPAPVVEYTSQSLQDYAASVPEEEYISPATAMSYAASAPVVEYSSPALVMSRVSFCDRAHLSSVNDDLRRTRSTAVHCVDASHCTHDY